MVDVRSKERRFAMWLLVACLLGVGAVITVALITSPNTRTPTLGNPAVSSANSQQASPTPPAKTSTSQSVEPPKEPRSPIERERDWLEHNLTPGTSVILAASAQSTPTKTQFVQESDRFEIIAWDADTWKASTFSYRKRRLYDELSESAVEYETGRKNVCMIKYKDLDLHDSGLVLRTLGLGKTDGSFSKAYDWTLVGRKNVGSVSCEERNQYADGTFVDSEPNRIVLTFQTSEAAQNAREGLAAHVAALGD